MHLFCLYNDKLVSILHVLVELFYKNNLNKLD